jgi:hypothetical protein
MRLGASSMITKQKGKAWNGGRQVLQDSKVLDLKKQNKKKPKTKQNKAGLFTFFDSQGNIHQEFIPPGQMMNKEYCEEILFRLA